MNKRIKKQFRIERDSLGEKEIPLTAYYGVQTVRAIENFPISGIMQYCEFIIATALIKKAAALANMEVGKLDKRRGNAISKAAEEIIEGKLHDQFVVDVFQAGAGTSHNMNANEVISNRAIEILGGGKGDYSVIHPNDHVNMSQSTNDVFPTAMRIAAVFAADKLVDVLRGLSKAFYSKGREFDKVIKSGRTHLQDAVPIRLGQELKSYGALIDNVTKELQQAGERMLLLGIGGSAVGTGVNTHPQYQKKLVTHLRRLTGIKFIGSENLIASMQSMGDFVMLSGVMRLLAVELIKIANDLRLMSSGPMTGLAEIRLPAVQPGSSIMPGKVNPVMAEVVNMTAFHVIGNDTAITLAAQAGQLELNVMMPVINYNLQQSIHLLTNVIKVFTDKCVKGIEANKDRCREFAERSPGLATILNQVIGYEAAAGIAKEALVSGKTIRELVVEKGILSQKDADKILDLYKMTVNAI
ncbi:MAG: aspartate ammonia-lyase [Thermodesulfovibrio sp. RBG_19FT_COMBO_42_12]|nr:MAG: aspartate ammonia-lyase [Thermodesulfovibrio sp. RBG_19FT_COMBO_42_12]HZX47693.1 aspartate ammonia-lyase [Nitrospirota bacterium]